MLIAKISMRVLEVEMKYWSRSALSIYKYLSTMANSLDKQVLDIGKSSNSAQLQRVQSTYFQANRIIELMDRKRKMINLKVSVEDTLGKLNKIDKRILTLVFIDGVKSEMVARMLNVSLRTFFRKKFSAMERFSAIFCELGYDNEFFEKEYGYEPWFMAVYNNCACKNSTNEETFDHGLIKNIMNEVSRINMAYNVYV